jgi:hypothetical protein
VLHVRRIIPARLEMAGDFDAAIVHYRTAAGRTTSVAERDYLSTRAGRLVGTGANAPADRIRSAALYVEDLRALEREVASDGTADR